MKLYRPFVACIFLTDLYKANSLKKFISQLLDKTMAMSAILISTASLSLPAYATSSTVNMDVKANITENCTMSNTDLNFGGYDAFGTNASQDLLATATITTTCTSGICAYITMDNGQKSTKVTSSGGRRGSITIETYHRHMSKTGSAGSDSMLQYELFKDVNRTIVWHNNVSQQITGEGASVDLPVYAKVFKNQRDAEAGSYTDTINITINY